MAKHESGRIEKREKVNQINRVYAQAEGLNQAEGPNWVFTIPWSANLYGRPSSFIIKFRRPIDYQKLISILRSVESDLEKAFLD